MVTATILDNSWKDKFKFKIRPEEWHENFGMSGLSVSSQLAFIMVMHALQSEPGTFGKLLKTVV